MWLTLTFTNFVFLVPTKISLSGNTAGIEGTNVTLHCLFVESFPKVNNVTFFIDTKPKEPTSVRKLHLVYYKQNILKPKKASETFHQPAQ